MNAMREPQVCLNRDGYNVANINISDILSQLEQRYHGDTEQ